VLKTVVLFCCVCRAYPRAIIGKYLAIVRSSGRRYSGDHHWSLSECRHYQSCIFWSIQAIPWY